MSIFVSGQPSCCNSCKGNIVVTETPTPGSTVGVTTAGSNAATVTFSRNQILLSFKIVANGVERPGTLSKVIGYKSTTFTLTPLGPVPVGPLTAFVETYDPVNDCKRRTRWMWNVST